MPGSSRWDQSESPTGPQQGLHNHLWHHVNNANIQVGKAVRLVGSSLRPSIRGQE